MEFIFTLIHGYLQLHCKIIRMTSIFSLSVAKGNDLKLLFSVSFCFLSAVLILLLYSHLEYSQDADAFECDPAKPTKCPFSLKSPLTFNAME